MMKTLIVDTDAHLSVIDLPLPRYTSKQALVKTIACGICGTDMKLIHGKFKNVGSEKYPVMLGHEGVGEVVEIGSEVTSFKVGDRVLLPFTDADPENFGEIGSAWGSFSQYGVITDQKAFKDGEEIPEVAYAQQVLPAHVDPVDAVMIVTLREVLSNIKYFGIQPRDTIVVYGSGPVALVFVKFLSLLQTKNIIAVVRNEYKEQLLKDAGATEVVNSSRCSPSKVIRERYPRGVDYVLDAVGSDAIINEGMGLIKDRGEILCYGVTETNSMQLDWTSAPYNWKINFQQMPSKEEEGECFEQILQWLDEGKLDLKEYISDYYPFEKILEAFDRFITHDIKKKCIITYE